MLSRLTARRWVLLLAVLAIAALVLLAASVSNLDLSPGHHLASRPSAGGLSLPIPDDLLDVLLSALLLIAPTLMLIGVLYALSASGFRARALLWFLWVALMITLLYLAMRLYPEFFQRLPHITGSHEPGVATPVATVTIESSGEFVARAPGWAEPVAAVGAALLASAAIVGGAWALVLRLRRPTSPVDRLAGEAQRALDALRAGADVRDTVMRCYFEMGRLLDEHHGVVRKEAMTPREFEQLLEGIELPRAHVEQLTRLFERVRYGAHAATEVQEHQAIACLTAIANARPRQSHSLGEGEL